MMIYASIKRASILEYYFDDDIYSSYMCECFNVSL